MSYKKSCNRCGQQILMDESLGKWRALNIDGTAHICQDKDQPQQQQQTEQKKSSSTSTLSFEEISDRLRRLEKAVFGTN
jgi:hypothetical protein